MEANKRKSDTFEIKVLKGEKEEIAEVQRVLEEAPDYFKRITGYLPSSEDAEGVFTALAPGKTYEDKFVFGVYLNDKDVKFIYSLLPPYGVLIFLFFWFICIITFLNARRDFKISKDHLSGFFILYLCNFLTKSKYLYPHIPLVKENDFRGYFA